MRALSVVSLGLAITGAVVFLTAASTTKSVQIFPSDSLKTNPAIDVSVWAKQPMLKNPVAISHDPQGRIYATEANRRRTVDLDTRGMGGLEPLPWPLVDHSLQSVQQRREVIREYLAPDSPYNNPWLKDYNEDGKKNWMDLLSKTERVNLLEDTDGNGTADKATVFAEGFNTEVTGTAGGVLWHNEKVYFTAIPDLWLLEDLDHDGVAEQREALVTGHGVHMSWGGHDLHGLTVGPDGRIYWSIGDKGINITSKEGRQFKYPNQGLVMRSEPDGSNFEVFAHGLRNCQELSFDDYGNLFCVDNDGDFKGERERLLYVTRDSDTGWRINWQFTSTNEWAKSQGLPEYNPWMEERLHVPHFEGQAAYITPTLLNYSDGPAGFMRNPGTALSESYKDYYFLTQFPGQKITAFQLQPRGAAFEMVNEHTFQKGFMAVGLSFGPEGALYVADWGGNWAPTEEGGIVKLDVKADEKHPLRKQTKKLIQAGMKDRSVDALVDLLGYPDQRIRLAAQFELVERSQEEALVQTALDKSEGPLARTHSIWGIGQLARMEKLSLQVDIPTLLADANHQIRIQTCRLIAEAPGLFDSFDIALHDLLEDAELSVTFHAAQALGSVGKANSIEPLFQLLASEVGSDPFIRHGAVTGLSGIGDEETILTAKDHESNSVRMGAVLALRRLKSAHAQAFLQDSDVTIVLEAARAIHDDFSIPDAMPALANLLNNTPHTSNEALMRRLLNANLRLGKPENAAAVLVYYLSGTGNNEMQKEAEDILLSWIHPPVLDRVERRYRVLPERDPAIITDLLNDQLANLLGSNSKSERSALKLLRHYDIALDPKALQKRLADNSRSTEERMDIFDVLIAQPKQHKAALKTAFKSTDTTLRIAALKALATKNESDAVSRIGKLLSSKNTPMAERQQAITILGELKGKKATKLISNLVFQLKQGDTQNSEKLEVFLTADKNGGFEKELTAIMKESGPGANAPYAFSMYGGDAARGEGIFLQHPAAQCIRCHAVDDGEGSNVGPVLKGVGTRFDRAYLLEALVSPTATMATGFGSAGSISAMPPMGDLLSANELRDLMAYLAAL